MTTFFWTVAEVLTLERAMPSAARPLTVDPVLLEVVDLVAADRAARAVDVEDGTAVLRAVERVLADVVDLAAGHVDVGAVGDDAVVRRPVRCRRSRCPEWPGSK